METYLRIVSTRNLKHKYDDNVAIEHASHLKLASVIELLNDAANPESESWLPFRCYCII